MADNASKWPKLAKKPLNRLNLPFVFLDERPSRRTVILKAFQTVGILYDSQYSMSHTLHAGAILAAFKNLQLMFESQGLWDLQSLQQIVLVPSALGISHFLSLRD